MMSANVPTLHEVPRRLYPSDVDWGYMGVLRPSVIEGVYYVVEED